VRRTMSLLLIAASSALAGSDVFAQELTFPASAVIRGENIRLRAEPSFAAQELEILERGDAITITGEAIAAEGDEFYPVEFAETGQAGWVRTIFVNPDSIVPIQVLEPANEDRPNRRNRQEEAPVKQPPGGEQGGTSATDVEETREERRARRQAERAAAEQDAAAEESTSPVPVEQTPAEEEPDTSPPADDASAAEVVTFAGEGRLTTEPVAMLAGDYIVTITSDVSAPSDVVVRLIDADEQAQRLFRESVGAQSWTAETEISIEADGDYAVRVSGLEDAWTITFEPIAE
jgi:hypothetical protein